MVFDTVRVRHRVVKERSGAQKQGYAIRQRRYGVDGGRESEEQALRHLMFSAPRGCPLPRLRQGYRLYFGRTRP